MCNPTNDVLYPVDWQALSLQIREANQWRCQECDKCCRRPGELYLGWEYELTLSHYNQDYDGEAIFVACLCAPCHLAHDAPFAWHARRRRNYLRQDLAGQLALFGQQR